MPYVRQKVVCINIMPRRDGLQPCYAGTKAHMVGHVYTVRPSSMRALTDTTNCQSLADMQQIYSQYFQTPFEHYREQSERAVERGKSMTEAVAESMESRANAAAEPARH